MISKRRNFRLRRHFVIFVVHIIFYKLVDAVENQNGTSILYSGSSSFVPTKQKAFLESNNHSTDSFFTSNVSTTSNLLRSRLKKPGTIMTLSLRPNNPKEILKMTQMVPKNNGLSSSKNMKDMDMLEFVTSTVNDLTQAPFSLSNNEKNQNKKYKLLDRLKKKTNQTLKPAESSTNYTYAMYGMKKSENDPSDSEKQFHLTTPSPNIPIGRQIGGHLAHYNQTELLGHNHKLHKDDKTQSSKTNGDDAMETEFLLYTDETQETRFVTAEQIGGNRPTDRPFHFTTTFPPPTTIRTTIKPKTRSPLKRNEYTKPYSPHNQFYAPTQSPINIAHNEDDLSVEDFKDFRAAHSAFGSKVGAAAVPQSESDILPINPIQIKQRNIKNHTPPPKPPPTVNSPIIIQRSRKNPITVTTSRPQSASSHILENDPDNLPFYKEPGGVFEQNKYSDNDNESNDVIGSQHVAPRGPGIKYAPRSPSPLPLPQTTASYSTRPNTPYDNGGHQPVSYNPSPVVQNFAPVPQQPVYLSPVPIEQHSHVSSPGPVYNTLYHPPPSTQQPQPSQHQYHPDSYRQPSRNIYPNPPPPRKNSSPYYNQNDNLPPPRHDPASDYYYGDPRPPKPEKISNSKSKNSKKAKKVRTPKEDDEPEENDEAREEEEDREEEPPPKITRNRKNSKNTRRDELERYSEPKRNYPEPPRPPSPPPNRNQFGGENDFQYGRDVDSEFDKHYRDSHYTPPAPEYKNIQNANRNRNPGESYHPNSNQQIDDYIRPSGENIVNDDYSDPNAHNIYKGRPPIPASRSPPNRHEDLDYRNPNPNFNYPNPRTRNPEHDNSQRPARIGYYGDDAGSNSDYQERDRPPLDPIYTRTIKEYDDELIRSQSPKNTRQNENQNYRPPIPNFDKQYPDLQNYKGPDDYASIGDDNHRNNRPNRNRERPQQYEPNEDDEYSPRPQKQRNRQEETREPEQEEEDDGEAESEDSRDSDRRRPVREEEENEEDEEKSEDEEAEEDESKQKEEKSEDDEEEEQPEDQEEETTTNKGRKKPPPKKPQSEKSGDLDEDIAGIENEFGSFFAPSPTTSGLSQGLGQPHPGFVQG